MAACCTFSGDTSHPITAQHGAFTRPGTKGSLFLHKSPRVYQNNRKWTKKIDREQSWVSPELSLAVEPQGGRRQMLRQ